MHPDILFPDSQLEKAVRLHLNYPRGKITLPQMKSLQKLSIARKNINSLSGIEYATNLTHLYFDQNYITDISPLRYLSRLEDVSFFCNQVTDVIPLASLAQLKTALFMENPVIKVFSPHENKTQISYKFIFMNLTHFTRYCKTTVKHRRFLNKYIDNPAYGHNLDILEQCPFMSIFLGTTVPLEAIREYFKYKLGKPKIAKQYVKDFIIGEPFTGLGLDFIHDYGSPLAKRLAMEYALKTNI